MQAWSLTILLGVSSLFFIFAVPVLTLVALHDRVKNSRSGSVSGMWIIGSMCGAGAVLFCPAAHGSCKLLALAPACAEAMMFIGSTAYWRISGLGDLRLAPNIQPIENQPRH